MLQLLMPSADKVACRVRFKGKHPCEKGKSVAPVFCSTTYCGGRLTHIQTCSFSSGGEAACVSVRRIFSYTATLKTCDK